MSRTTHSRPLQRLGLVGVGSAILLVGIAPAASAAETVVIPLEPPVVGVAAFPVENFGGVMDLMADSAGADYGAVPVEYGDALTIELPAEIVSPDMEVELRFDNDGDGTSERTYSTGAGAPDPLTVAGLGTDTLTITLPADDGVNGPLAYLTVDPVTTDFSPAFVVTPTEYFLEIDSVPLDPVTLTPPLLADGYLGCTSPATCTLTADSTFALSLPASSLLRELGITDFTGVEVALQALDADGIPTGDAPVELAVQASADGQTASVVLPAGTAAGSYGLLVAQPLASGAAVVFADVTVETAAVAAPAAPNTAAAPTTAAPVNAGLHSNTGAEAAEAGSTGDLAVAAGAGMLLLAGAGGVAVARDRRRTAAGGGTCGA